MITKVKKINVSNLGVATLHIPAIFMQLTGAEKGDIYKMTLNKDNSITLVLVKGDKDAQ